jgi:hypothetical protein
MLRINRVKIEITTANGVYGVDETFCKGLNFLASEDNTCGKSSILAAMYYCLGLEEIIGGKGEKVLTSVFKTTIEDGTKSWPVLDSAAFLEISNGKEIVTLYRTAIMQNRDSRMITVFYGAMDAISNSKIPSKDMYVHFPNSTINEKGFHNFLEKFLFLELPLVTSADDAQRKLYLQLIFSGMFIEQKHGWSALFSGMPILGIKESKKRVVEFLLKLDTLENDKIRDELKLKESIINSKWKNCVNELLANVNRETCQIINLPPNPKILKENELSRIEIMKNDDAIADAISKLENQLLDLQKLKPRVVDNFDELQIELEETETATSEIENLLITHKQQLLYEDGSIKAITQNLETVAIDLSNNKDAARLRKLGSDISCDTSKDICPICHQHIEDSLLLLASDIPVMSIDENIRHLEAQKEMLNFALLSHKQKKDTLKKDIKNLESRLFTLRRLAQSIRNDLYTTNDEYSETIVYKRLTIEKQVDNLLNLQNDLVHKIELFKELSAEWRELLENQKKLPKEKFSDTDKKKLQLLRNTFIKNLQLYGYKSIPSLDAITISVESYLPIFEGFDIKFDSSASDNIRVIWAFTMALLQVSIELDGNHPSILIFDEPDQQSTIIADMEAFFKNILSLQNNSQVIIGITLKDSDTKAVISNLEKDYYKVIDVPHKAFKLMSKRP